MQEGHVASSWHFSDFLCKKLKKIPSESPPESSPILPRCSQTPVGFFAISLSRILAPPAVMQEGHIASSCISQTFCAKTQKNSFRIASRILQYSLDVLKHLSVFAISLSRILAPCCDAGGHITSCISQTFCARNSKNFLRIASRILSNTPSMFSNTCRFSNRRPSTPCFCRKAPRSASYSWPITSLCGAPSSSTARLHSTQKKSTT